MKDRKILRFFILLVVLLVLGSLIGYVSLTRIFPVLLSERMEEILSEYTGQETAIGRTSVQLFPGAVITLDSVRVGTSEKPLAEIGRIKAQASLWDAFFGALNISFLTLEEPRFALDPVVMEKFGGVQTSEGMPAVVIHNGTVALPGKASGPVIQSINGTMGPDGVELTAEILGGRTSLSARGGKEWSGVLTARGMDLSRLADRTEGSLDMQADFTVAGGRVDSGVRLSGSGVAFPWSETKIETLGMAFKAQGGTDALYLREFSLTSPMVRVDGSGWIREPLKILDASISLDLSSGIFEYEKIVDLLPTRNFHPWLEKLLTSQIRGGTSRFASAHYEGTVAELVHFTRFIDHIMVVQDLMGQSFRYGSGPEKITDISGRVIYGDGDIMFRDLSGFVNGSVVDRVDLSFPGVIVPGLRIGVDVKVDMPARDFLDAWNAVGLPVYALDLFEGVTAVQEGNVAGEVSTLFDSTAQKPFVLKGGLALKDCSYRWGGHAVRSHSGTAAAPDFSSPVEISSKLTVGSSRIRSLKIVLADPFGERKSSFRADLDGGFAWENFSFGKGTAIRISGTGEGPVISASAAVRSGSFALFGSSYKLKDKPVEMTAQIMGTLRPELSLRFTGKTLPSSSETFTVSGHAGPGRGEVRISGLLNLDKLQAVQAGASRSLSGEMQGDIHITWGEKTAVRGSLEFRKAMLFVNGSGMTVDGPVLMSGSTLKTGGLRILMDETRITVSDGLLTLSDRPVFRGDITIEGSVLPLEKKDVMENLSSYTASGHVRFLDLDLYGIPVDEAKADALLEDGVLALSDIRAAGSSGTIQGSLSADSSGVLSHDISFSLLNVNINRFFNAMSEEQDWIRGNMNLSGRLVKENGSIHGTLNLVAKNGRIKKYALASRIFALLNIYKIIQARDIELTSRNFPYNIITCTFRFEDSIMRFDDFYLDSNSLQLSAVGEYSLKTRDIDAVLGIQPFETIDKAISWIPLLGWVLTGDDGRLLVVSLKLTGQLDDPSVQIAPIETISVPIRESIARALDLPAGIRNEFRKYVPNRKN